MLNKVVTFKEIEKRLLWKENSNN